MTIHLRAASHLNLAEILPRIRALNAQEGITIAQHELEAALQRLLADANLGGVWMIEQGSSSIGYAIVTYGFDLEYGGRDAYLTELWIDEAARGHGAGRAALALLDDELRARDVRALHLQVRADNPAVRLYDRAGFVRSPRLVMTRRLALATRDE